MTTNCFYCHSFPIPSEDRLGVIKSGSYKRKSSRKPIPRFYCKDCHRTFSHETDTLNYRQRYRHLNTTLISQFSSGLSQRRLAVLLGINRKTVIRKFLLLGKFTSYILPQLNSYFPPIEEFQFDDLETYEHTKCKPLAASIAVESKTRRIIGLRVGAMPCKGVLAKISLQKYGPRKDERFQMREDLFTEIKPYTQENVVIKTDNHPHYKKPIKAHFPKAEHIAYESRRARSNGYGELKKGWYDPLFSLNHTYAMCRDNINRLRRRTWSTTKKAERLFYHLSLYAYFHNSVLIHNLSR